MTVEVGAPMGEQDDGDDDDDGVVVVVEEDASVSFLVSYVHVVFHHVHMVSAEVLLYLEK